MRERVVVDSTCLIGLERIARLDILPALFDPVTIPPEVEREFGVALPWLKIEAPADGALITALKMLVDDGEAEAIALAREVGCELILDDRQARAVARNIGLRVVGTIGILIRAKREGVINALKPVVDELERAGFFLSGELKEEALRLVGE